ncbi:MAG: CAP domain-containing protein [Pararobbsia sp.]
MKPISDVFAALASRAAVLACVALLTACGGGGSSPTDTGASQSAAAAPATLMVPAFAPQTVVATGDPAADSVTYLNSTHFNIGYPGVPAIDAGLASVAKNHTLYLVDNATSGHGETPGAPGFTGATPAARIAAVGSYAPTGEVVIGGDPAAFPSSVSPVQVLFDAPYHRLVMLGNFAQMGVASTTGAAWQALTIDFGNQIASANELQLAAYPYPGQTGAATHWLANEEPNPFATQPQYAMTTVGYPITIQSTVGTMLNSIAFTLTDAGGNNVACLAVTPATDNTLSNGAMCIPYAPLQANTRYVIHVTGVLAVQGVLAQTSEAHPIDVSWSFTTIQAAVSRAQMTSPQQERALPRF